MANLIAIVIILKNLKKIIKEIKIDHRNTSDVQKPNACDKNIIIYTESLTTLITKFTV